MKQISLLLGISLTSDGGRNVGHEPFVMALRYFPDDLLGDLVITIGLMDDGTLLL